MVLVVGDLGVPGMVLVVGDLGVPGMILIVGDLGVPGMILIVGDLSVPGMILVVGDLGVPGVILVVGGGEAVVPLRQVGVQHRLDDPGAGVIVGDRQSRRGDQVDVLEQLVDIERRGRGVGLRGDQVASVVDIEVAAEHRRIIAGEEEAQIIAPRSRAEGIDRPQLPGDQRAGDVEPGWRQQGDPAQVTGARTGGGGRERGAVDVIVEVEGVYRPQQGCADVIAAGRHHAVLVAAEAVEGVEQGGDRAQ